MAMSFPIPKSRPKLGGETLELCPYDDYHWVRPTKMDEHVVKCRKNLDEDLFKTKGYCQSVVRCMYNCQHQVYEGEWKFHMARCPDRKNLWTYNVLTAPLKEKFPGLLAMIGEDLPIKKDELKEMYDGLNPGELFTGYGKQVKLAYIGKEPKEIAQYDAEAKGRALADELEMENGAGSWGSRKKKPEFQIRYTKEEIDYWNPPPSKKVQPYSWLAQNLHPKGYVPNYPPGLTKRERREFDKRNAALFEKKLAKEAAAREAAAAAREGEHEDEECEQDSNFSGEPEEKEDDDGWVSQFTIGPTIVHLGS